MIEIILRDDINDYEPKAFFGQTKRSVCVAVLLLCIAGATAAVLSIFHMPLVLIGYFIVIEGIVIGIAGLGKFSGQHLEKFLSIAMDEFFVPSELEYVQSHITTSSEKKLKEINHAFSRKQKRCYKKEKE